MEEEIFYKGYKIKVRQNDDSESPDNWGDKRLFLVYDHRNFIIEREGFDSKGIFDYLNLLNNKPKVGDAYTEDEINERIYEWEDDLKDYFDYESEYYIFPVEAYIHSGVSLSLFNGTKQCRWDSSVSGYILASKDEFKAEEDAKIAAENLITDWNHYLSGEVYGYIIEKQNTIYSVNKKKIDVVFKMCNNIITKNKFEFICDTEDEWEYIDSCWDFYGDPYKSGLIDEAKSVIDSLN